MLDDDGDEIYELCPVCTPLDYYGGKSGHTEVQATMMCDSCLDGLTGLLQFMDKLTGEDFVPSRDPVVQDTEWARLMLAYLVGSGLPYVIAPVNKGEWKIEAMTGIPLSMPWSDYQMQAFGVLI